MKYSTYGLTQTLHSIVVAMFLLLEVAVHKAESPVYVTTCCCFPYWYNQLRFLWDIVEVLNFS